VSERVPFLDTLARAKRGGDCGALTEAIPYARFLGIRAEKVAGELLCRLPYLPANVGNTALPALHGGVLGALLESSAVVHLLWEVDTVHLPKTITITVDYLRSARPVETFARGKITRLGRRIATVQIEAWQDDRTQPIASAVARFLLTPAEGPARITEGPARITEGPARTEGPVGGASQGP
jgi:uncharacterized protein (TIGR00369 family)